ncbi:hypothetical protein [Mucilaginibacter sp.]|uniref:hypothetical protein n=1 Tax=Mucilaginibacter sp. TaxID=1882438 RepID=UPI002627850D|nr:hypothetical protein [Mucilaginibacter sp.]
MKKRFCLLLMLTVITLSTYAVAIKGTIAIIYDHQNNGAVFTAAEMAKYLQSAGYTISSSAKTYLILTLRGTKETSGFTLPESESQGYSVRKKGNDWYIIGFDNSGLISGGLDVAENIKLNGLASITDTDKKPFLQNRGIKFNIPLDARTPSYTDNGDAGQHNIANMWDMGFWHEFLDEMARDRYNIISIWSLQPFPSLVKVPEYPNASLSDIKKTTVRLHPTSDGEDMFTPASNAHLVTLKKMTIAQKIKFWQDVMQYAHDRGIDFYLFTWNVFINGLENSGYGFTDKMSDEKTKDYIRKATATLIKTYPLLKGIGLTSGENMHKQTEDAKEKYLYETYGQGINDALANEPTRTFKLIHRTHQTDVNIIKNNFTGLNSRCPLEFSFKYSVAHMYSATAPKYIYEQKFLDGIGDSRYFFTVREDSWYNMRGGSDPAFTRDYIKNMPKYRDHLEGFYMGPDGYTWGREYISKTPATPRQLIIKKRWYSFQLMGKLAYDPTLPDSYFAKEIKAHFPEANVQRLQTAWAKASQIMPVINRFHNQKSQNDYEWYPEACTSFYGFMTIDKFINRGPQNGEGMIGIPAYGNALLNGQSITDTTPPQVAENLQNLSDEALALVKGMTNTKDNELNQTINDIKAMAYLGQYFSKKILVATNKYLSDKATDEATKIKYKAIALDNLQAASLKWAAYANQVSATYIPQFLARLHMLIDFKALQTDVDKEISQLKNAPLEAAPPVPKPLQQLEVVFFKNSNYYFWHLANLGITVDWSQNKYVVLDVYATTAQKFNFLVNTERDSLSIKGIQPIPDKWTKIAIPLSRYKAQLATKYPAGNTAAFLKDVKGLGLQMANPVGYALVETRAISLVNEVPEGAVIVQ